MTYYCQCCGASFEDHPANPFPRACWKCGGAWWSSRPSCRCWPFQYGRDYSNYVMGMYGPIMPSEYYTTSAPRFTVP